MKTLCRLDTTDTDSLSSSKIVKLVSPGDHMEVLDRSRAHTSDHP